MDVEKNSNLKMFNSLIYVLKSLSIIGFPKTRKPDGENPRITHWLN